MCPFPTSVFPLVEIDVQDFFYFVFGTYFLTAMFTEFFIYSRYKSLAVTCTFSQSMACLFISLTESLIEKKRLLILMKSNLLILFSFWISSLVPGQRLSQAVVFLFSKTGV